MENERIIRTDVVAEVRTSIGVSVTRRLSVGRLRNEDGRDEWD